MLTTNRTIKKKKSTHKMLQNTVFLKHFNVFSYILFNLLFVAMWYWEGNGNPLQYSCLWNPMDRGAWWAIVHGVIKESDMTWD